ncbi:MAG: hypothetical protein LAP87_12825 [Acidobacteriia bacterium]|nr:hypothetical protein [Terriglobia bacterium]
MTFLVRVDIGADGSVKGIGFPKDAVPPAVSARIESAINQWTFRPFVEAGQPVAIAAHVLIAITPAGDVGSAVAQ